MFIIRRKEERKTKIVGSINDVVVGAHVPDKQIQEYHLHEKLPHLHFICSTLYAFPI
jgi:hypothetical protein